VNFSYNISDHLDSYLKTIDYIRAEILTYPISPKNEMRLKWDANLERVIWTASLTDNQLSKSEVIKLLSSSVFSPKKKLTKDEKDILSLKNSFSYIRENWFVSKNTVTLSTIKKLYDVSSKLTYGTMTGLTEFSVRQIKVLLEYLQKGADRPFIQAGIAQAQLFNITPFDNGNGRISRLLSYLYLYKNGYDVREMLNLEEFYKQDMLTYKRMLETHKTKGNLTMWLEYFAYGATKTLENILYKIQNLKFQEKMPVSFWKLSNRQKKIIEFLENPQENITNKQVQKLFKVSQITASRDLTHLTNLGLLLSHGKGRSIFYTKA